MVVRAGAGAQRLDEHHATADRGRLAGEADKKFAEEAPGRPLGQHQDGRALRRAVLRVSRRHAGRIPSHLRPSHRHTVR